jgi:hypothetical protein
MSLSYLRSSRIVFFDLFTSSNVFQNSASTSFNDVFGVFTICP